MMFFLLTHEAEERFTRSGRSSDWLLSYSAFPK